MRTTTRMALAVALSTTVSGTGVRAAVRAVETEDDLAVVKRAVAQSPEARTPEAKVKAEPPSPRKGEKPRWLRIRVTDKAEKKGKVSINVPLGLVEAVGDDWPLDFHCGRNRAEGRKGDRCHLRLSEVLEALRSGQDLVEIDDDEASVRIWVD
jgi:hypothetical protein